ncbi:hypothetical protein ACFXAW_14835 [Streptomyces sp. NPDC059445]|uniref:hypothetical protein n=1 Tax=unclassified Streptomyces TaxID=2593676 RepID=UPI0036BADFCA
MPPQKRRSDLEAGQGASVSDGEDSTASVDSVREIPFVGVPAVPAATAGTDRTSVPVPIIAPEGMPELPERPHPEREQGIYYQEGVGRPPSYLAQGTSGKIWQYTTGAKNWVVANAEPIISFATKALPIAAQIASVYAEGDTAKRLQTAAPYLAGTEALGNLGITAYKAYHDPDVNRTRAVVSVLGSAATIGGTVMSAQAADPDRTRQQLQQLTTWGTTLTLGGSLTSYQQRATQGGFLPTTASPEASVGSNTSLPGDNYPMNRVPPASAALASASSVASLRSPGAETSTAPAATSSALPSPPPKAVTQRTNLAQ